MLFKIDAPALTYRKKFTIFTFFIYVGIKKILHIVVKYDSVVYISYTILIVYMLAFIQFAVRSYDDALYALSKTCAEFLRAHEAVNGLFPIIF